MLNSATRKESFYGDEYRSALLACLSWSTPLLSSLLPIVAQYLPFFIGLDRPSPFNSLALTFFMSPGVCSTFFPAFSNTTSDTAVTNGTANMSALPLSPLQVTMNALMNVNCYIEAEAVAGVDLPWDLYRFGSLIQELVEKEKMLGSPLLWAKKLRFYTQKIIRGKTCSHIRYSYMPNLFLAVNKNKEKHVSMLDVYCFNKNYTFYDFCWGCRTQVLCTSEERLLIPASCELLVFDFFTSLSGGCVFPLELDLSKYLSAGSHFMEAGNAETPRVVRTTKEEFEQTSREVVGPCHWTLVSVILSSGAIIKDRESGCWYDFREPKVKRFDLSVLCEAMTENKPGQYNVDLLVYERRLSAANVRVDLNS